VSDVAIETVVGPEVVTGSTRLKAGTAQKLVLNTISTLTMVHLGKVYGNLMVDVRATNEKLRARSERIVMLATGTDAGTAARALAEVDGWVKAAVLVVLTGLDGEHAVRLLRENAGMLRDAIVAAPVA
jgi:N-acetylmuramic acid 6-phosphate etherase